MVPWWLLAVVVFGANFALWGAVGVLRLVDAAATGWRHHRRNRGQRGNQGQRGNRGQSRIRWLRGNPWSGRLRRLPGIRWLRVHRQLRGLRRLGRTPRLSRIQRLRGIQRVGGIRRPGRTWQLRGTRWLGRTRWLVRIPRLGRVRRLGRIWRRRGNDPSTAALPAASRIGADEVAVLIAAHNEEPVIVDSLTAITALVPPENVHVVSDASTDRTVELAEACGVHVITTASNVGKAGALQAGIARFELVERFRAVMLLDADTRVEPGYFANALPLFDDPRVVAVAGCVRATKHFRRLSRFGRLIACHRQRIYSTTQYVLKFGQTWRWVNATHIVPGFASLYRADVLPHMEVNPPGLVIEDFNMTFQVYQRRLGKVGFTPAAVAETQDPDTPRDYVRQVRRWSLGLWQTVRLHPPRCNLFSLMLAVMLLELISSSIMIVLLPVVLLMLAVPALLALAVPGAGAFEAVVTSYVSPESLLYGVLVPDLLLTCCVAAFLRQPRYFVYGWFFLLLRVVDSALALAALVLAWRTRSTGRWKSPQRQRITEEPTDAKAG